MEKKHLLRFRPGGETVIDTVGELSAKYGITLSDMPVQGMYDDITLSKRLASLTRVAALLAERLTDTTSQARSEAWQAATGNYSVLSRVSAANPSLSSELDPVRKFFARKARGKATAAAPPQGGPTPADPTPVKVTEAGPDAVLTAPKLPTK